MLAHAMYLDRLGHVIDTLYTDGWWMVHDAFTGETIVCQTGEPMLW